MAIHIAAKQKDRERINLQQARLDVEFAVVAAYLNYLAAQEVLRTQVSFRLLVDRALEIAGTRVVLEGVSEIDEALCHGCGICAAECPAKAIELNWYEDEQIMSKVDALLEGVL